MDDLKHENSYRHPEVLELPNPSPPISMPTYTTNNTIQGQNYGLHTPNGYPQISKPTKTQVTRFQSSESPSRIHFSPSTGKTPRGEKEVVAELLTVLVDCMEELNTRNKESLLRKFFSEMERDERLERFIVERIRQSKVKAISELCEKLPQEQIGNSEGERVGSVVNDEDGGFAEAEGDYGECSERGIVEAVEELSQKLEKFKMKPLDMRGVVKNEEWK